MCPAIQAIRDESRAVGMTAGKAARKISILFDLVKDGIFSIDETTDRANMSVAEFRQKIQSLVL